MTEIRKRITDTYTNRELGILMNEMNEQLNGKLDDMKTENIKAHATLDTNQKATNGQVKSLQLWRAGLTGGVAILTFLTPFVWYLIIHSISNFDKSIDKKVSEAIQANNEKYFINSPNQ